MTYFTRFIYTSLMICRIQEIGSTQNFHLPMVAAEVASLGKQWLVTSKLGSWLSMFGGDGSGGSSSTSHIRPLL